MDRNSLQGAGSIARTPATIHIDTAPDEPSQAMSGLRAAQVQAMPRRLSQSVPLETPATAIPLTQRDVRQSGSTFITYKSSAGHHRYIINGESVHPAHLNAAREDLQAAAATYPELMDVINQLNLIEELANG